MTPDIIQRTLITMRGLRAMIDGWFPLPSPNTESSSHGVDPGDECGCGQCSARAQLQELYYQLRRDHL